MKHLIEFEMPEDRDNLKWAMQGFDYRMVCEELNNWLKMLSEHSQDDEPHMSTDSAIRCRDKLWELMKDRDVSIYD